MKEKDIRPIVEDWFCRQGYDVAYEILFGQGFCDLVAFKFSPRINRRIPKLLSVIAVELKINDTGWVLEQAKGNKFMVNASYAAMPEKKFQQKTIDRFCKSGIGLLSINSNSVKLVIKPSYEKRNFDDFESTGTLKQRLWRHKKDKSII